MSRYRIRERAVGPRDIVYEVEQRTWCFILFLWDSTAMPKFSDRKEAEKYIIDALAQEKLQKNCRTYKVGL